ncbi:DUF192 domain-containing protein [Rhizosaccharibacter radicis]|uniref:DUF192 domain-containing protein n=1 Tax=Rhizosaccharibacter radicis TaxID=2782605 RepID=A0ABT1VZK1_9PROT|nr:DUF192 domain-containing protein [Acetobacteraceae bacterium KSS12]
MTACRRQWLVALALCGAVAGGASAAVAQDAGEPTAAQPTLPKEKLVIVGGDGTRHEFQVELARTPREQEVGLMFRPSIPADGGMLFPWDSVRPVQMWMKNCPVPEDMVFINPDGTIRTIAENTVPRSLAVVDSDGPVAATLELQGGLTGRLGIRVGDKVEAKSLSGGRT